ncbi:MAG: acyl-CoA thioesterase [Candidatus Marinimicrobia bacterium]|nr:acyl-CoA thioesterase [Candidatus Neomarinimicrobiota bacterium]
MISNIQIKIRGYHLDLYGHVNNTRYLEFLEEARWTIKEKYFDSQNKRDEEFGFVVVNTNINYRNYTQLGDTLEIRTTISHIGNKSAVFRHEIYLIGSDKLIADADVTFVIIDRSTGKAMPIESEWRTRLEVLYNQPFSGHQ